MRPIPRILLAVLLILPAAGSQAISLGEIEVSSALGEPLRASIAITLDDNILPQQGCFRIAEETLQHPDLADAQLALVNKGRQHRLLITTGRRIDDPMLELVLRMEDCGPSVQRIYPILLSPREVLVGKGAPAPRKVGASMPVALPSADGGAPPNARRMFLRMDYSFASLAHVGKPWKKADKRMAPRLRDVAREQPKFLRIEPPPPQAEAPAPPPPADKVVPQEAVTAEAAQPVTRPLTEPAITAQAMGGTAMESRPPSGMASLPGPKAPPATEGGTGSVLLYLPFLGLLLLLAASVAWWLKFRTAAVRERAQAKERMEPPRVTHWDEAEEQPEAFQAELDAKVSPAAVEVMHFDVVEEPETVPEQKVREPEPIPFHWEETALDSGLTAPAEDDWQAETLEHVIELAEVMLAFGRSSQAMETLSKYIRDNPRQAVDPWLRLLDLYYRSDLRAEYETLARQLNKYFNVAIPEWEEFALDRRPPPGHLSLESLPHIMTRIMSTWGSRQCLSYLEHLLTDNRDGKRMGFTLPIVREIMLLRDILRHFAPPEGGQADSGGG